MGLITKAVDKMEAKEESTVRQKSPPEVEKRKLGGRRRLLLLIAAALLLGVTSAGGYLLLLKPGSEPPPTVTRRSISARKKLTKPGRSSAQKKKKGSALKENTRAGSDAAVQAVRRSTLEREPLKEGEEAAQQRGEPAEPTGEPSSQKEVTRAPAAGDESIPAAKVPEKSSAASTPETETGSIDDQKPAGEEGSLGPAPEGMLPEMQRESDALPPSVDQQEETDVQTEPEADEEATLGAEYWPSQPEDREGDVEDQLQADPIEVESIEEMTAVHPAEPPREREPGPLQIKQRSESRARRYYSKGLSYQQHGQLGQAIDAYKRALSFNPDHPQANMNLAVAYLQVGRFKEAEQILVYMYASKPKDSEVLYNFGLLLYQTGELASAKSKLERLLEIDPFHLQANLLLAGIYEERGQLDKAVQSCQKAYRINSADPRVLYRLGRVWDLAGRSEKAIKYYQRFLDTGSEKEDQLELAVRDRLKYLSSAKGEK